MVPRQMQRNVGNDTSSYRYYMRVCEITKIFHSLLQGVVRVIRAFCQNRDSPLIPLFASSLAGRIGGSALVTMPNVRALFNVHRPSLLCRHWMLSDNGLGRAIVSKLIGRSIGQLCADSLYACQWPPLQTIAEWENDPCGQCGAIWLPTLVWLSMVRVLFIINVSASSACFLGWRNCSRRHYTHFPTNGTIRRRYQC